MMVVALEVGAWVVVVEEGVNGKVGDVWETGENKDGVGVGRSPDTRRVPAMGLPPTPAEGVREGEEKMDGARCKAAVTGEEV